MFRHTALTHPFKIRQSVQFEVSNFEFEMQESSNFDFSIQSPQLHFCALWVLPKSDAGGEHRSLFLAGLKKNAEGTVLARQQLSHSVHQRSGRKRLLQKRGARFEHTVVADDVVRVSGHVQNSNTVPCLFDALR